VREMVEERQLSMGHARALLALESVDDMEVSARTVVAKGLSVRATEDLVRRRSQPEKEPRSRPAAPTKTAVVRDLEERLTKAVGGPVTVVEDAPGKGGTVTLRYHDLDHLDLILEKLL